MARLASLIKGGYYPLSDANTQAAATLVTPAVVEDWRDNPYWERRPYTLLDPFCGEGRAVRALADAWNAVPYGVELHPERAEAAKGAPRRERPVRPRRGADEFGV
ncbi:MAG: DUF6094 domain-containing protein [Anaerolineae bacterium]|nr:DUF6094 domain-containing protein [Anaerolineae bacterium]